MSSEYIVKKVIATNDAPCTEAYNKKPRNLLLYNTVISQRLRLFIAPALRVASNMAINLFPIEPCCSTDSLSVLYKYKYKYKYKDKYKGKYKGQDKDKDKDKDKGQNQDKDKYEGKY